MIWLMAVVCGILGGLSLYLLLRRSFVKVLIGLMILGQVVNLIILTVGGLTKGKPTFIPDGKSFMQEPYSDPIPQALILTAIVISFAVQAFVLVLFKKTYQKLESDDLDGLIGLDKPTTEGEE